MRQLADARRRLAAAETALAEAQAAAKQAETGFDAANDASLRPRLPWMLPARSAPGHGRPGMRPVGHMSGASVAADRLARRVRELSERLDTMQD
jgi:hypothetical protein